MNQSGALVTGSGSGLMDGGRSDGETWARRAADLKVSYGLGSGGILFWKSLACCLSMPILSFLSIALSESMWMTALGT